MTDIQELLVRNLLFAIMRSKNNVISAEKAAEVVGAENVEPLRQLMNERKWLMGRHSSIEHGFQLTAKGMQEAMRLFINEVESEGIKPSTTSIMEIYGRLKEPLGPPEEWSEREPLKVYARGGQAQAYLLTPGDIPLRTDLLGCIPLEWQRVCGELRAPEHLVSSGQASSHGGYYLGMSRHYWTSDHDERSDGPGGRIMPPEQFSPMMTKIRFDLLDMLMRHKLPGFIKFDEAGSFGQGHELPFASLLLIITAYVKRGYGGRIRLYRSDITEDRAHETVEFYLDEWVENSFGLRTNRPPIVQVAWHDHEEVAELLEMCSERELQQVPTHTA